MESARHFFRAGGAANLVRKDLAAQSYERHGAPLEPAVDVALREALHEELGLREEEPIRLLDVGSCGTLFEGYDGIEATALDLCPQRGNERVMQ